MISGAVQQTGNGREPTGEGRVALHIEDIAGVLHLIEFIVDTGFDLYLTLPTATIQRLGLPYLRQGRALLGDNEVREFAVYGAIVSWQGQSIPVSVFQSETQPPLLGMAMLWGSRLTIDARDGGQVTIEDLSEG